MCHFSVYIVLITSSFVCLAFSVQLWHTASFCFSCSRVLL
uniref:Uncharacterized protein n=1 Tax=Arundo donax TaxID=35708 RepID=A0A0A9HM94_ARUDO